jgi:NADH dehydrogenase
VFVIGDVALSTNEDGSPLTTGRAGRDPRRSSRRRSDASRIGLPTEPFRYKDKGSMATIGRNAAVAELPNGVKLTGPVGWLAWLGLHLLYLIGFRNRANVLVNWAWNYVTYDRGARLIGDDTNDPPTL